MTDARRHASRFLSAIGWMLMLPVTAFGMDLEREVDFNIPAQELGSALLQFSQQTRIQVIVSGDIRGESSQGVRGRRVIKQALEELLRPAGLNYRVASDDSITVAKATSAAASTASAAANVPIRLAQSDEVRPQPGETSEPVGTPARSGADTQPVAEVAITGSRLVNKHLVDAAPVTVLSANDIAQSGTTSVGELLRELPAAVASTSESAGRGNNGSATIALRGLGAVNTLVLINGRRVLGNNASGTVDLNSIPFDAIERVEVLKDGASAVYGSDAIAGVINIIMASNYEGLQIKGGYGVSSRGDLPMRELSLTFGRDYDGGNFVFNANWNDSEGNVIADRPVSLDPDWRSLGGRNFRDPLPPYPVVTGVDPTRLNRRMILREGVTQGDSLDDFRDFVFPGTTTPLTSGNDGINYWEYESSAVDISKLNLWFSGEFEMNDAVSTFAEASFNNRQSFGFFAPDYVGSVYGAPVTVTATNDFNPFGRNLDVARTLIEQLDYADLRARIKDVDANTFRVVAGLKGSLGERWKWDASFNHQQLHEYSYGGKNKVMQLIRQAAGDSNACRAATNRCVPINLLGGPGAITKAMLDFISVDTFTDIRTELGSIVANVTGTVFSLPAGDVGLAAGVEHRTDEFDLTASDLNAFIEQGTDADAHPPRREVNEVYLEAGVPLLTASSFIGSVDLDLAARYSDYDDFGSTTNPKVGLRWQVFDSLLVRSSWGTGFRAPTFFEAYGAQTRGFQPVNDPCLGPNFMNYPACNGQQATTTAPGAFVVRGGNPALRPEEAENLTVGLVWRPRFLPGLAMTLDHFKIEKSDGIGAASANFVIEQNALFGTFADRVTRDANNAVSQVIITLDNLLDREVEGFDFGVEYQTETERFGAFDARLDATWLDRAGTYSTETGTLAKWRVGGRLGWSWRNLGVGTSFRYVDDVLNTGSLLVGGQFLRADDYLQNDVNARYDIERWNTRVTLGVENVFDEMPPWLEGNFSNGFDERSFNSRGRYYYSRVEVRF